LNGRAKLKKKKKKLKKARIPHGPLRLHGTERHEARLIIVGRFLISKEKFKIWQ
jgi:hypothetical protein